LRADGLLCLTYAGIHCYDAGSGDVAWSEKFKVIENELAMSYANPVIDGATIIATGDNRVRAFDLETGKPLWRSERFNIISELLPGRQLIYGQLGGQFFNIDKEKWQWKGRFGVFALDKSNGETVWKYEKGNDSITNLLVYDDVIWLADEKHLLALDRFDGSVRQRFKHHFDEPPIYTALNEAGQILLLGEGEVSAFDPELETSVWYVQHTPVGPGAWRRFSRGLLGATGNVLKFGSFILSRGVGLLPSLAIPIGSVNFKLLNTKKIVSSSMARTGRRMTYQSRSRAGGTDNANLSGDYQYFVTRSKYSEKVVLAVVDLRSGKTVRMIRVNAEYPSLVIDEGNNKIYESHEQQLLALPLDNDMRVHSSIQAKTSAISEK
jgi:hypothetical protein